MIASRDWALSCTRSVTDYPEEALVCLVEQSLCNRARIGEGKTSRTLVIITYYHHFHQSKYVVSSYQRRGQLSNAQCTIARNMFMKIGIPWELAIQRIQGSRGCNYKPLVVQWVKVQGWFTWESIAILSSDFPKTWAGTSIWRSFAVMVAWQPLSLGKSLEVCIVSRRIQSNVFEFALCLPVFCEPHVWEANNERSPLKFPRWYSTLRKRQCLFCSHW